jgi:hypothetical protein
MCQRKNLISCDRTSRRLRGNLTRKRGKYRIWHRSYTINGGRSRKSGRLMGSQVLMSNLRSIKARYQITIV